MNLDLYFDYGAELHS